MKLKELKELFKIQLHRYEGYLIVTKLRTLADWFDMKFPDDKDPEVQNDLRALANNIEKALEEEWVTKKLKK